MEEQHYWPMTADAMDARIAAACDKGGYVQFKEWTVRGWPNPFTGRMGYYLCSPDGKIVERFEGYGLLMWSHFQFQRPHVKKLTIHLP